MNRPIIYNIQKFSIHDGNGIRTTLFFKGCPLRCTWCHNPESQNYNTEIMFYADKCTACGKCVKACKQGAVSIKFDKQKNPTVETDRKKCTTCGACVDVCLHEGRELCGHDKQYEVKDLVKMILRDRMFFEKSKGGVTLSGGEVMTQDIDYIVSLAAALHNEDISVNIDTCGDVEYDRFKKLLPYVDTWLYDIKLMDPVLHKTYTGHDNKRILENLIKLSEDDAKINIRMPLIGGINDNDEYIDSVIKFLNENNINVYQVNLLPYHDTGKHKYLKLGLIYKAASAVSPKNLWIDKCLRKFIKNGYRRVKRGG